MEKIKSIRVMYWITHGNEISFKKSIINPFIIYWIMKEKYINFKKSQAHHNKNAIK